MIHTFPRIRPCLLIAAALAAFVATGRPSTAKDTNRLNVLFIAIDDLRTELGCYGVKHARSPNLDRLAAQGVLFTNHFTAVPTCGASRYAMLTGRSPRSSGVTSSNAALYAGPAALTRKAGPAAQTMPELFRRSG